MQTDADVPDQLAGALMRLFVHVMKTSQDDFLRVIAELDLTIPQMRALFVLNGSDRALALTELAPRMGLSVAAAGRAVDGLVRTELISRTEDPADRRIKRLALTARGLETIALVAGSRRAGMRQFAAALDEPERGQLARALSAALERLEAGDCGQGVRR